MSELCAGLAAGSAPSAGAHLLEPRRGDVRGAAPRPARLRRLHQAGRIAPAGAVPHPAARRLRRLRAAGPRPALLLRAGRAAPAAACALPRLTAVAHAPTASPMQTPTDYSLSVARPLRSGDHRARQEARRGGEGGLVGDGRRRDAPPRRPGRAVRPGRRFAAPPLPVRRVVRRRAAAPRSRRPSSRAPRRRRRWRWKSRPACSTSRRRSRTATSTTPSMPTASRRLGERLAAVRQAAPPQPLEAGWRSSTGASPTARPWAASSRSCAPRSVRRREGDRRILPQPRRTRASWSTCRCSSRRCAACCRCSAWTRRRRRCLRMRDEVDGLVSTEVDPEQDRQGRRVRPHRRQPGRARLHDRHAERAAAARQVAVRVRRREGNAGAADGPRAVPSSGRPSRRRSSRT